MLFSPLHLASFKSVSPTEVAVSPLAKEYLRKSMAKRHKTHNSCSTGQARGACHLSYSQRERNRSYKDKESKENRLDMREIKRELFNQTPAYMKTDLEQGRFVN